MPKALTLTAIVKTPSYNITTVMTIMEAWS